MSDPFLSEIKICSFNFPPRGWALCNGQLLPINQNQALFSLLGTTYGGDGRVNFALPDLRGRAPLHFGRGHTLGEVGGEQAHTLTSGEMPTHIHSANASSAAGNDPTPGAHLLASPLSASYRAPGTAVALAASTIGNIGGSQAHQNMQPYLVLSFCIALQGIFPSQN